MASGSQPGERRGGRKKGQPNRATADLKADLEAMGYGHPVKNMAALAMRLDPAFTKCKVPDLAIAAKLHGEISRYVEPQRKAIEVQAKNEGNTVPLATLLTNLHKIENGGGDGGKGGAAA